MKTDPKNVNQKFYDKNAKVWRSQFLAVYHQAEFNKFCQIVHTGKVLDIGCGAGRDTDLFQSAGYEYTGIDISEGMLAEAKAQHPSASFIKMDLAELKFADGYFDGVWSIATYLHVPKTEIAQALKELSRVLKVNGAAYLKMKKGDSESYVGSGDDKRFFALYDKPQFADQLRKAGFQIVEVWEDDRNNNKLDDSPVWLCFLVRKQKLPLE